MILDLFGLGLTIEINYLSSDTVYDQLIIIIVEIVKIWIYLA